jgi:hypothetical protein
LLVVVRGFTYADGKGLAPAEQEHCLLENELPRVARGAVGSLYVHGKHGIVFFEEVTV